MLTRVHRFHGHNALRPLYQKGKSVYSPNIKLLYAPSQKHNYRVSVVVSKKVHKSAVVRNRIRRRVYEYVREYLQATTNSVDLIFIVQAPHLADIPADELQKELDSLLQKATSSI